MRLSLPPEAAGYRLLALEATESTNDDALRAARAGDPGPLWIVAGEQRSGRGRHGRNWSSPLGNLYASLLLVDACASAKAPQLGFVAGLALHEAVEAVTGIGAPRLALKWPNDLLLDGAKVSGLLLEGHRVGSAEAIVIGFGINIAHAPEGTPYPAAALRAVDADVTCTAVFESLADRFAIGFAAWKAGNPLDVDDPFGPTRRRWLERAAGLGTEVTLRLPSGERRGVFAGLDRLGRLRLQTAAGVELVDAGDLYFPHFRSTNAGPAADMRH